MSVIKPLVTTESGLTIQLNFSLISSLMSRLLFHLRKAATNPSNVSLSTRLTPISWITGETGEDEDGVEMDNLTDKELDLWVAEHLGDPLLYE